MITKPFLLPLSALALLLTPTLHAQAQTQPTAAPTPITLDPTHTYQTIDGFGGALTDASAYLIGKAATPAQRDQLLHTLFDPETGAGLSYVRLPIGACDFSLTEHTYDDLPPGQTDEKLAHFSIAYDEAYIIPVLKQALAINPRLKFMASPWSPPAWMKTSGKLDGGRLKPDNATYRAYADYLVRFVQAYAADGIPIDMLTLQNEPWNETANYPSMHVDPAEEIRLVKLLGPRLRAAGLQTKIVVWDHNWDDPEYPTQVLADPDARPYIDGAAFHGYAGNVSAQLTFHDADPTANIYFTESSGGTWAPEFGGNLMWDTENLIVGATRNYAKTVVKWNLVLDENNGPHVPGGPNNCRGIVTFNRQTGAITREEEFYAFAQAARFVQPGAKRIDSSAPASVAFLNPDGSTAVLLYNTTRQPQTYTLNVGDHTLTETLPARSVATLTWAGDSSAVHTYLTTGDRKSLLAPQPLVSFQSRNTASATASLP